MIKINKKINSILMIFAAMMLSSFVFASFLVKIMNVNADSLPILVNLDHISFGTVFPGETSLRKNFLVSYAGTDGGNINYNVIENYKPLPDATSPEGYNGTISEYCQEHFDDQDRCYKFLCPFIEEFSEENEGDVVSDASVSSTDIKDNWIVAFNKNIVPAIIGNVAQDHEGDIISENGIYGCDLSINIEDPESFCGDGKIDANEKCDDGNKNSGDGCSSSCTTEGGGGGGHQPSIRITKTPSVYLLNSPGGDVTYSYSVFNGGYYPIYDIIIEDDKCKPLKFIEGDKNNDKMLDIDEVWKYDCIAKITETTLNIVKVTGKTSAGNVSDSANAKVTVKWPNVTIKIVKTAEPINFGPEGGMSTYSYAVTNPGLYALSNVTVTDRDCSPVEYKNGDANANNKLENTETWLYTCLANIVDTITTSSTARGEVDGKYATDLDDVTVYVGEVKGTSIVIPKGLPKTGRQIEDMRSNSLNPNSAEQTTANLYLISGVIMFFILYKKIVDIAKLHLH